MVRIKGEIIILSLRKLINTAPETLLYIERFQPCKLVPDFLIMTVRNYVNSKNMLVYSDELFVATKNRFVFSFLDTLAEMENEKVTDSDWINKVICELKKEIDVDELEGKINKVLSKYPNYVAGEHVENDLLR